MIIMMITVTFLGLDAATDGPAAPGPAPRLRPGPARAQGPAASRGIRGRDCSTVSLSRSSSLSLSLSRHGLSGLARGLPRQVH